MYSNVANSCEPQALFRRGVARARIGELEGAKVDLMAVIKADPRNGGAKKELKVCTWLCLPQVGICALWFACVLFAAHFILMYVVYGSIEKILAVGSCGRSFQKTAGVSCTNEHCVMCCSSRFK